MIGPILVRTIRHFFPDFNGWLDAFPDLRDPKRVSYHRRFLLWIGLFLFLGKLGSRRQIDFQLSEPGTKVLGNLNRLAGTQQTTMPVNKTLDNYLAGVGTNPLRELRRQMIHRLVRMRVLDGARLQRHYMVLVDGTGYLVFQERHCDHCLTRKHGDKTLYMHQVLEAKILGPGGMVLSIATEFIDNRDSRTAGGYGGGETQARLRVESAAPIGRETAAGLPATADLFERRLLERLRRGFPDRQGLRSAVHLRL